VDPSKQSATSQTAYKWGFASKRTKAENDALQVTRAEVGAATYSVGNADGPSTTSGEDRSKRVQGPTLPSQADHILAREAAEEQAAAEREYQRKRDKAEARGRIEDMVGPREVGRERMLEKKRERRESDRTFREKGDEGLEMDEGTLMGGGDSFKAQWVFPISSPTSCAYLLLVNANAQSFARQNCPQGCSACETGCCTRRQNICVTRARHGHTRKGQGDDGYVHADGQAEVRVKIVYTIVLQYLRSVRHPRPNQRSA